MIPPSKREYLLKRPIDIVLALTALIVLSPIFIAVALAVRLTMGGPIFFRQRRVGHMGREFSILKFRTMTDARDASGELLPDFQRLTRLGSFMRTASLDELPGLLQVIGGQISLVGPRPLLPRYMPYYTQEERHRFTVRPGITGLAQISGRNTVRWDARLRYDVEYARRQSLLLDLKILVGTVRAVLLRDGASADPDLVETWLDEERAAQPPMSGGGP